ncbi:hypothetical protein Zm00014a_028383 [Zea mays]|nr:hypothetical protein Zm00014a_028383 [Zea mays]
MLTDQSWTEILKRRDMYREAFACFDPSAVARMEEDDVAEISGNRELRLAACAGSGASWQTPAASRRWPGSSGSFSGYMWRGPHVNHRWPVVGKHRYHHKYVPFRTPRSEAVSRPPAAPTRRPRHRLLLHVGRRHGRRSPRRLVPRLRPPRRPLQSRGIANVAA